MPLTGSRKNQLQPHMSENTVFVYLDETTFGDIDQYSGYGSLISNVRIDFSIIEKALLALSSDPDIKKAKFEKYDERTLDREYFHASEDSQNGHSHLCNAINTHFKGKFSSHFFDVGAGGFSDIEEAYDLASKLSVMEVLMDAREVVFIFEERNNLTQGYVKKWWKGMWEEMFKNQHKFPYIRTYFPSLEFEICGKREPGLQIVDFILWASSRRFLGKSCPWFSRLKPWFTAEMKPANKSWGGQSLTFGLEEKVSKDNYDVEDFSPHDETLYTSDFLPNHIISCQQFINSVADTKDLDGVGHFKDEIDYLRRTSCVRSNAAHIEKMAKCFLKLFDNVGVISQEIATEDKAFWLACRKCFSFALNTDTTMGRVHSIRLSDIRNAIIEQNPKELC